jgi:aminoglycoside phosphotransferase family enzyme
MAERSADGLGPCPSLEAKIAYLRQPGSYPEHPERVATVETHMSWVFLTDLYAYKLKKPVRYGFLDFSTVSARHRNCQEELRLNRRLAPAVYLGIVPLTVDHRGKMGLAGEGKAVDWLVKMHRLPAHRRLDWMIRQQTLEEAALGPAAALLARFYLSAAPFPMPPQEYVRRFQEDVQYNLTELDIPQNPPLAALARRTSTAQLRFLERQAETLEKRVLEGRIIEAHGDLRPEHIYLGPEPKIVDCLEFKQAFRILDPADELAFLAMECERLGAPSVGKQIFSTYTDIVGDAPPLTLLGFYKSYRACLRARLAYGHTLEAGMQDVSRWLHLAYEYLSLADSYSHILG